MSRQRMTYGEAEHKRFVLRLLRRVGGSHCHWCGRAVRKARASLKGPIPNDIATLDHLEPVSKGGLTNTHNCVVACYACNTERGDMPADRWRDKIAARTRTEARAA